MNYDKRQRFKIINSGHCSSAPSLRKVILFPRRELNDDPRTCVTHDQTHTLQLHGAGEVRKFTFDTICFNESQEEIFERVGRKCTLDCLEGTIHYI